MLKKRSFIKKTFFLSLTGFLSIAHCKIDEIILFNPKNTDFQAFTKLTEVELIPILNFLKGEETTCSWVAEYDIITNLITSMNLKVGCEIGVAYGLQSIYFLENSPIEKLYSVDPYMHFDDYADVMNLSQPYFDTLYYRVKMRLGDFGERSILLRQTSLKAAEQFEENSLDFVYIDANHSYKAVTEDLETWVPKVRSGGLVSGDDYVVFATTARAVDRFVRKHNIKLDTYKNKWWFIKP